MFGTMPNSSLAALRDDLRRGPRPWQAGRALTGGAVLLATSLAAVLGAALLPPPSPPSPRPPSVSPSPPVSHASGSVLRRPCDVGSASVGLPAGASEAVEVGAEPVAVDTDGDGCAEAVGWEDGVLTLGEARFALGGAGDRVFVGDWDCDTTLTPALVRGDGRVFVFRSWGGVDGAETARSRDDLEVACTSPSGAGS